MNYKVNGKVFASEKEAKEFLMDLRAYGCIGEYSPTQEGVTHYYIGDLTTEPAKDVFICEEQDERYQKGLSDAWECIRKIAMTERHESIVAYLDYLENVYGTSSATDVIATYSAFEAVTKMKAYDKR